MNTHEKQTCDRCGYCLPVFSFAVKRSDGKRKRTCKRCVRELRGEMSKAQTNSWVDRLLKDLDGTDY